MKTKNGQYTTRIDIVVINKTNQNVEATESNGLLVNPTEPEKITRPKKHNSGQPVGAYRRFLALDRR